MVIKSSGLRKIREKHANQKIVFAGGCFDLTHAGHVIFIEEAKKHGDVLVAQVGSDDEIRHKKKREPIFNESIRLKIIDSLKPVDYTFVEKFLPNANHPLQGKNEILEKLKPDVYVTNADSTDAEYLKKITGKRGIQLVVLDRYCPPEFDNISTTKIIEKLKNEPS